VDFIGIEAIFKRLIEQDGVTGVPGNPELDELVVNEGGDYDEAFEELVQTGSMLKRSTIAFGSAMRRR
jgi:hypothetical protein